jgi:hypothetical protein
MVLAGQPVTGIGMVCVAVAHALFAPYDEGTRFRSRLAWVSVAAVGGLLLAAVQILPILAVLGEARRSDPAVLDYLTWSLHPLRLIETVVPMPFGNGAMLAPQYGPWMTTLNSGREPLLLSVYVGVATLALATLGSLAGLSRTVVVWLVLACFGLVFAFGEHAGLLPAVIDLVPALKIFRMPEKHIVETRPPLLVRAADGWDARAFVGERLGEYRERDPDAFPRLFSLPGADYSTGNAIIGARLATNPSLFGLRDAFTDDTTNVWPREFYAARDRFHFASPNQRAAFLHRTGVRVQVLVHPPIGNYGSPEPVESAGAIDAYQALEPVERAMLVPEQAVEPNTIRGCDALFRPDFDFRRLALVDRAATPAGTPGAATGRTVQVLAETANTIAFGVECDVESTLVVLDSYAPGWRVEVDGQEADLVRADGLFRGVRLVPGQHTVAMEYVAPGFRAGAAISVATALLLIAAAWRERLRSRQAATA